jgi:hypothetical protein
MGEVIGKADPHDATANDDHAGVGGKLGHGKRLLGSLKLCSTGIKTQIYHRQS